jgi:hypothetical protein
LNEKDQKIIHRWDYGRNRSTWTTQSSKNIAKVLDHLKLGLDDETTPDSLKNQFTLLIKCNKDTGVRVFVK